LVQVGLGLIAGVVGPVGPDAESPPQPVINKAAHRAALAGTRRKKGVMVTAEDAGREGRKIAAGRPRSMPRLA
jgi:hypothetical protein